MKEQLSSYYMTPRPAPSKRPYVRGQSLVVDAVNTILWLYWDPIGCGVPLDEYRHVAEDIVRMRFSEPVQVECHLLTYQRTWLEMSPPFDMQKLSMVASRAIEALRNLPHNSLYKESATCSVIQTGSFATGDED